MHYSIQKHLLIFCFIFFTCAIHPSAKESDILLIINSFNENEPWVNDMVQPIMLDMASNPSAHCEFYDLNNALIKDTLDFENVSKEVIKAYKSNPPSFVVMIGSLAFNMRKQIKDEWGDVPILLLSTTKDYIPLKDYFYSGKPVVEMGKHYGIASQQEEYNMTAIIIPQYYKQTVSMMAEMLPDMDELVFMSDSIYANRKMAYDIQQYLRQDYPEIKFTWLKASVENAEKFHASLVSKDLKRGLLLSTWLYAKQSTTNWKSPSTGDLKLISASHNPVFSMNEAYLSVGTIGGVFPSMELAKQKALDVVHAMLNGDNISDIPIYICEQSYPCINYLLLKKFDISERLCPEGTVYISKPQSFIEKYLWQSISVLLVFSLLIIVLLTHNTSQRKKIKAYRRNAEFVNNMPIPYSQAKVRYDTDDNVTTIAYNEKNSAFEKILAENVVADSPFMLFPAEFIAPKVTQLLKDSRPQEFVYHFKKTDSYYEFILCLVNNSPKKDKKGHLTQTIDIFAKDITSRFKMETNLESAMRTLDLTINIAKLVPWQYDVQRDTIYYDNHGGNTVIGASKIDGETPFDDFVKTKVHPDDQYLLRQCRDEIRCGKTNEFNLRLRKIDPDHPGEVLWVEMVGKVTTFDQSHNYKVVIGASCDITDDIRSQKAMALALERANESDRMKSAFLASISHEIRTPLNAIVGFSNVIAYTEDANERLGFCDIINQNNEQLLALINDVLDLAKIESNAIDIEYTDTDINNMLEGIYKSMSSKVPNGIKFTLIKGSNICVAEIDKQRVTQIISNMLSNSCKFTPTGSISFGYDVRDNGMLYFYVRDTGIGLSHENQEKVFDRFFKLDTFVPGTGLGLSICKNLVEKMGGEIGVESSGEGKGSIFWFTIPYVPCLQSETIKIDTNSFYKTHIPHLSTRSGRDRLKVLIAEDNESNYRLLEHLLHNHFDLIRASNGNEAVRKFIKEDPDVVLMDISMPGMDGYTALKEIRKFSATVPVIAVTAYVYASEKSKLIEYGFDGYVSKPITQKDIIDAIGHAITHH